MKRGEVYFITSKYQESGSEQWGDRPALIVSNDKNNTCCNTVEIVYMTTQPKKDLPTHVFVRSTAKPSTVLCEQVYTVSTMRVGDYLGKLTSAEMEQIDLALAISLGLDFGTMETEPVEVEKVVMREPTDEEWAEIRNSVREEILATMTAQDPTQAPPVIEAPQKEAKPKTMTDAQSVKLKTERDLYKRFTEELLEIMKGSGRGPKGEAQL